MVLLAPLGDGSELTSLHANHWTLREGGPTLSTVLSEPQSPLNPRLYLDKKEAGQILGLSPKTIERLIQRGEIPAFKPAGKVRIHPDDLYAWLDSTKIEPSVHDI